MRTLSPRAGLIVMVLLLSSTGTPLGQERSLDIYWIDVEGGAATLIVSPSGESLLYDAGWEVDGRDGKRIAAVVQQAGLKKIDHFVLSHFHADHAGGLQELSKLVPIGRCFDRGDFIEPANQKWRDIYLNACASKRTILKAGDTIPLKGVRIDVVASNGQLIAKPLAGGGANPLCASAENKPAEGPENQFMVGALFTYGKFRFLDLGDLDWQKEMELACPINRIGQVTIWQAGRHGALDGAGAPGLLHAIKPQVVVVNNGPRKGLGGGSTSAPKPLTRHYERIAAIPGIEGVWQGHLSLLEKDKTSNTSEDMIANFEESAECKGHWIRASVKPDGTFTIANGRNGFSKTYTTR
ncbi:MAG TPA: MBL fold metallo-hydrolase [Vicinamibacterales bacterium]|nr:MBL fold metallo-hydrolase [Vicinamibacterales bacterium]